MHFLSLFTGLFVAIAAFLGFAPPPQEAVPIDQSLASTSVQTGAAQSPPSAGATALLLDASSTDPFAARSAGTSTESSLPEGSPWLTTLPLGDGLYTTSGPERGYIYLCDVAPGVAAGEGNPPWIQGAAWSPGDKVLVEGSVTWPDAIFSMSVVGSKRLLSGNGLPIDHPTGTFPIQPGDPAYEIDTNPNTIRPQSVSLILPETPTMLAAPDCIYGQVGVMKDGVALFDGFDAQYRDALAHEVQDEWEGHPDKDGTYHTHGFGTYFVKDTVATVEGFALDGYPITGSRLPNNNYLHTADLDECHGLTSTIMLDGNEVTTYHYVLTQDFPYSVGCFRGMSHEPRPDLSQGVGGGAPAGH